MRVCVTHHAFMSDRLCVFTGYSRDRLPFNCFVLRESIAHCALMLPISSLIILPLIWAVAEMAGSCVFLYLRLLINNLFIHTADNPQTDFLIKILIQFVSESPVWTVQLLSCIQCITLWLQIFILLTLLVLWFCRIAISQLIIKLSFGN